MGTAAGLVSAGKAARGESAGRFTVLSQGMKIPGEHLHPGGGVMSGGGEPLARARLLQLCLPSSRCPSSGSARTSAPCLPCPLPALARLSKEPRRANRRVPAPSPLCSRTFGGNKTEPFPSPRGVRGPRCPKPPQQEGRARARRVRGSPRGGGCSSPPCQAARAAPRLLHAAEVARGSPEELIKARQKAG